MIKYKFQNQSLINIIVLLVVAGLVGGGLYLYISKQSLEIEDTNGQLEDVNDQEREGTGEEDPGEDIGAPEDIEDPGDTEDPEEPVVEKCLDETLYGQCSIDKPSYCDEGNLIDKASLCGCPVGYEVSDNQCLTEVICQDECSSIDLKRCHNSGYQACGDYDADGCLEWGSDIACFSDMICQDGDCIQQTCSDETLYGQCSDDEPKYCESGELIDKCSVCGCSSNQYCNESSESCEVKSINPIVRGGVIDSVYYMNNPQGIHVSGNYAYVTGNSSNSLAVIDISNSSSPEIVGGVISTYLGGASSVYVSGDYAYVTGASSDSLVAIDISNPFSPAIIGIASSSSYMNGAQGVYVSGDYAYVTGASSDSLVVIDISNPFSPAIIGIAASSSYMNNAQRVCVSGDYAYVTGNSSNSLAVVDISDTSSPEIVGQVIDSTYLNGAFSVYVSGEYAYVGGLGATGIVGDSYLAIVDISNPFSPSVVGKITDVILDDIYSVYVDGEYAYVTSYGVDALVIIDISDPFSPQIIENVADSTYMNGSYSLYVSGENIYVGGKLSDSLAVISIYEE